MISVVFKAFSLSSLLLPICLSVRLPAVQKAFSNSEQVEEEEKEELPVQTRFRTVAEMQRFSHSGVSFDRCLFSLNRSTVR